MTIPIQVHRARALALGLARRCTCAAILFLGLPTVPLAAPGAESAAEAAPEPPTVVVLGDSLAAGYGLDLTEAFPGLLQELATKTGIPAKVINAGVSGDTTAGGLRRIEWLLKRRMDVLVLELGGNDGLRGMPVAVTRTNLQAIIDRTKEKYPAVSVVVAGMQMPPNMGREYNEAFARIFPELAKTNGAALVPFLLEGVGGRPELNQPDSIHPTAEGQKIVAENVWKVLKPVLEQRRRGNF